MNEVEVYPAPLEVKKSFDVKNDGAEMTDWELGFLCGLIREYKPNKIVEVGVAAGGTTAIVLNCLSLLKIKAEMYSIDLNSRYYRDDRYETGYLVNNISDKITTKHTFCLGGLSTDYVEQIGKNIDFLILDTAHSLPGELLDFLTFVPFLKDGAVVVLHDIALSHLVAEPRNWFATKLLMDLVDADKLYQINPEYGMPSIGTFVVTEETRNCVPDILKALQMKWNYMPTDQQMQSYRLFFEKIYGDSFKADFELAVNMNQYSFYKQKKSMQKKTMDTIQSLISLIRKIDGREFYIYGKGVVAIELSKILCMQGLTCEKYILSDDKVLSLQEDDKICISRVPKSALIIIGVSDRYRDEIYTYLVEKKYQNIICLDNNIVNFIMDNC